MFDASAASPLAVSLALVEEFVSSWRAEVEEYDVTPTGGVISLRIPDDREFRIARTKATTQHAHRVLRLSGEILHESQTHAALARAHLTGRPASAPSAG